MIPTMQKDTKIPYSNLKSEHEIKTVECLHLSPIFLQRRQKWLVFELRKSNYGLKVITVTVISLPDKKLEFLKELENQHNRNVISVHSKKTNQRKKNFRTHSWSFLTGAVDRLMSKWEDLQVIDKVDVKNRVPSEGTRVPGGGIEITYYFFPLHGEKVQKSNLGEEN